MPDEGFVFAVSGAAYLPLTVRAAETIRRHHPDHPIDLFTDVPCDASVFSQVTMLQTSGFRPKFEALRRSRFDRSIYLDGDVICTAPMADVFDLLDHFDIAAAHEPNRNSDWGRKPFRAAIPAAFPQINSGCIGLRASPQTRAFMQSIEAVLTESGYDRDQPVLRELLYQSDLRLAVLPTEYNLIEFTALEAMGRRTAAPRLLHLPRLHKHLRKQRRRRELRTLEEVCGPRYARHIKRLIAADRTLGNDGSATPLLRSGLLGAIRLLVNDIPAGLRRLFARY
ncbi:hypothetical protein FHY55_05835 [Oceanicola sp. D3]|uniref:putative nucleotide-diphospho-sugar transferase n=1 Tax=Oceanicola sp. D3 TaxID=2587163 RepID=UPI00112456AF|nr:putative nucleotide-diphospho-sugar transferase [Oceanicola sp. D3]QDC08785.1 hypothetical protein FHY55_05835 [Oceanicola sp. D3]